MNRFLKFYVMGRTEIDLYSIAHLKVEFIPVLKIYIIRILRRFVLSMHFEQCEGCSETSQQKLGKGSEKARQRLGKGPANAQ